MLDLNPHADICVAQQMPRTTILQIDAEILTDFLRRESGGVLRIICERGPSPARPYANFGRENEHQMTLSYGLGSALVQYMSRHHAEPRSDGTYVATDYQK